jgi:hypothetical protein
MKLSHTIIATALVFSAVPAHAELLKTDWKTAGDSMGVLDTESGLEWLHLGQTVNKSIDDVSALLDTTYAGWRLPEASEVGELFTNSFGVGFNQGITQVSSIPDIASNWQAQFGGGYYQNSTQNTWFSTGRFLMDGIASLSGVTLTYRSSNGWITTFSNSQGSGGTVTRSSSHGIFLVSDGGTTLSSQLDPTINANNAEAPINNVSAPTIMGGLLALFGIVSARRR